MPRQPLQNHSPGHLGEWATPWSAGEMLHGHYQRVDIPAHVRTAQCLRPAGKSGRGYLLNRPPCPLDGLVGQETDLN